MAEQNAEQGTAPVNKPEKTFTQSELNAIIEDRLGKEKAKYADYDDLKAKAAEYDKQVNANKTELEKALDRATKAEAKVSAMTEAAKLQGLKAKVSTATGVPADLLHGTTEEELTSSANAIKKYAGNAAPAPYPSLRDGGDAGGGGSTRDLFATWVENNFTI